MKTINVEGIVMSEKLIDHLKYIQDAEVQASIMENMIKINGFLVDRLNYEPSNNNDYVDCLQYLNVLMKFVQFISKED